MVLDQTTGAILFEKNAGAVLPIASITKLMTAMVALDARIRLQGPSGARAIAASDFFTGYLSTVIGPDELLTEVEVPVTRGMGFAVEEFSRRPGDFALVAVAVLVAIDRRGWDDAACTSTG